MPAQQRHLELRHQRLGHGGENHLNPARLNGGENLRHQRVNRQIKDEDEADQHRRGGYEQHFAQRHQVRQHGFARFLQAIGGFAIGGLCVG